MSKALVISDLHLELESKDNIRLKKIDGVDYLILAGDIGKYNSHLDFIKDVSTKYKVIYVLGNHEFYNHTVDQVIDFWKKVNIPNFYFLNDDSVVLDGIRFIGSTLWTNYFNENALVMNAALSSDMRDYQRIKIVENGKQRFVVPEDLLKLFNHSFLYIKNEVKKTFEGKTVVVTHHPPSMKSISKKFRKSENYEANYLFASDLDDFITQNKIDILVHGHVHDIFDYMIGNTRIVCNPKGYNFESRFGSFEYKIIEI